jgi:hypothetical protein
MPSAPPNSELVSEIPAALPAEAAAEDPDVLISDAHAARELAVTQRELAVPEREARFAARAARCSAAVGRRFWS